MALTYVQLKQAIQDWTENDSTEFTAATGSGVAPIDVCIVNAELRITKELDLTAFRKTTTIASGTAATGVALPEDLVVLRFLRIQNGAMIYEKDETYIREYTHNPATTGTIIYYALQRPGTAYTTSNRYTNILFAPTPEAATFMKDSAQLQNYQQLYERSAQTLGVEEQVRMRNTELYKGELRTLGRLEGDR